MKFELTINGQPQPEEVVQANFWLEKNADGSISLMLDNKRVKYDRIPVLTITTDGKIKLTAYSDYPETGHEFFKYTKRGPSSRYGIICKYPQVIHE